MAVVIERWPADQAILLSRAHIEMNPQHFIHICMCDECCAPIGMFCACHEFIVAIDGDCEHG